MGRSAYLRACPDALDRIRHGRGVVAAHTDKCCEDEGCDPARLQTPGAAAGPWLLVRLHRYQEGLLVTNADEVQPVRRRGRAGVIARRTCEQFDEVVRVALEH